MTRLIILRGIPASGKTTYAQKWVSDDQHNAHGPSRYRFSRDDIRWEYFNKYWGLDRAQEDFVTARQAARISSALKSGANVMVDDTNLRARTVKALLRVARHAGAEVSHIDFPITVEEAINRDAIREGLGRRFVGEDVIRMFYQKFTPKGTFPEFPTLEPETSSGFRLYEPDRDKPVAWMCDLDGTIALLNGRSPYDETKVSEDLVNWPVRAVVLALASRRGANGWAKQIIFTSGRTEGCRADTEKWLDDLDIGPYVLLMRTVGDTRPDPVVKHEMFYRHIAPNWWVQGVLDDRDRVVAMWREIGLTCLQVAPGAF